MERNQSSVGRIFRVAGGLFVLSLSLLGPQAIWGLLGIIPLVSGLSGFDPAHGILDSVGRRLAPVPAGGVR
jgi:hypothetical protein